MRASSAVGLLLVGSMSVFGIFSSKKNHAQAQPIEPVWVNGQQGVYSPSTGAFVPSTSPNYADACDEIRDSRSAAGIYGNPTTGPYSTSAYSSGSTYYHNYHYFGSSYGTWSHSGSSGGFSSGSSSSSSNSSSSFGSSRGGIGETGHSFGGSHS